MKKALVTGSQGFIGKFLVSRLLSSGFYVIEVNRENGDITDFNTFENLLDEKIDHIFHLAARTFIPESWEKPSFFYNINFIGTENVLEFSRIKSLPLTFISAYLYGEPESLPISESHIIKPNNPYAHSKYLAEQLCQFYSEYYGLKVCVIRPFNIYGAGQNIKFIIPHIINQALYKDSIRVNSLIPKRDFLFIDDFIDFILLSMNIKQNFSVFNIGSGRSFSIFDIISTVQSILGTNKKVISENINRLNEIDNLIADISKAKKEFNWNPKHSFYEGLRKIIESEQDKEL